MTEIEEESSETDSNNSTTEEKAAKMTDSVATCREYVRHVSSTIPEFDDQKMILIRFLGALRIILYERGYIFRSQVYGGILPDD